MDGLLLDRRRQTEFGSRALRMLIAELRAEIGDLRRCVRELEEENQRRGGRVCALERENRALRERIGCSSTASFSGH